MRADGRPVTVLYMLLLLRARLTRRRDAAALAAAVLLLGAGAAQAAPEPVGSPSVAPQSADGPADLVLLPGPTNAYNPLGPSNRTPSLIENAETVRGLQGTFDGITIDFPTGWEMMTPGYVADATTERKTYVEPLLDSGVLDGFDHNLVRAQVRPEVAWDDDAAWDQIAANVSALTELSVAVGSRGLFFDIENYTDVAGDGTPWDEGLLNWDESVDGPLEAAEIQARDRGAQVMSAVLAVDPDAEVVFSLGAAGCATDPERISTNGTPEALELQCPFMSGAVDVATTPGQVQDGGELYKLRTAEEFDKSYTWRDQTVLDQPQLDYMSDADRVRWTEYVGQSNGVQTKWSQNPDYQMDPTTFADTLCQALQSADSVAWAFVAEDDLLRPGFPADWRQGFDDGVACAANGTP